MVSMAKTWHLLPHDAAAIDRLVRAARLSPIVAQLLLNRQITTPEDVQRFLAAPLTGLHEPELLPGMDEAVERLLAATRDQRLICIYGDYDVDGVTGTAILLMCLTLLGAKVEFHVPHRLEEGVTVSTVKRLHFGRAWRKAPRHGRLWHRFVGRGRRSPTSRLGTNHYRSP